MSIASFKISGNKKKISYEMIHKGQRNKYPDHFEITHKIKQKRNKLVSPPQSKNKMISEDTFDLSMYQKKKVLRIGH